jgi:hypothetical protein
MRKRLDFVNIILHILALLIAIVPATACTLSYFPLWAESSGARINGAAALLLVIAFMPLCKLLYRALRSPSVTLVWFILFLLFFLLSRIADEMTVISFVGFASNLLSSVLFRIARRRGDRSE